MSRRAVFAIAAAPAIAWIPVTLWLHAHLDEWIGSGTVLPLGVRLALFADNQFVRVMPFAVLAIALAMPLLAWGAAHLRASGPAGHVRSLATWSCLSLGLQCAAFVAFWKAPTALVLAGLLSAWWVGIVAYVLGLGAAVAVQRDRWSAGRSTWHPRTVLWIGWLATFVGGAGYLVPALVWFGARRDQRLAARTPSSAR